MRTPKLHAVLLTIALGSVPPAFAADESTMIADAADRLAASGKSLVVANDKLHARGPVGLEGLTSLKYVVFGNGEVRA